MSPRLRPPVVEPLGIAAIAVFNAEAIFAMSSALLRQPELLTVSVTTPGADCLTLQAPAFAERVSATASKMDEVQRLNMGLLKKRKVRHGSDIAPVAAPLSWRTPEAFSLDRRLCVPSFQKVCPCMLIELPMQYGHAIY